MSKTVAIFGANSAQGSPVVTQALENTFNVSLPTVAEHVANWQSLLIERDNIYKHLNALVKTTHRKVYARKTK